VRRGIRLENLRKGDHLEDVIVNEKIILKWIFKKWDGTINWIDLAHDEDGWPALENAVINIRVP
jgi:hypothetical protein